MGKRLYVGNLSQDTDNNSLREIFTPLGTVELVHILNDKGISRGFGFVEMGSEREAIAAMRTLNGTELNGSTIVVNEATPPGDRKGGNGGGGFGRRRFGSR